MSERSFLRFYGSTSHIVDCGTGALGKVRALFGTKGSKYHDIGHIGFSFWESYLWFWVDTFYLGTWTLKPLGLGSRDCSFGLW